MEGLLYGRTEKQPSTVTFVGTAVGASLLALLLLARRGRKEAPVEAGPLPLVGGLLKFLRVRALS
jgi:hypothetical protein